MTKKEIRTELIEHYGEVLLKNQRYQMGDDDFQPTTKEKELINSIRILLCDLENNPDQIKQ